MTKSPDALANARRALEALLFLEEITGRRGFPARSYIRRGDPMPTSGEWHWTDDGQIYWKGDTRIARKQKRKLTYMSNILVIKDSANPQNEGKVFLYKYGKKIFDKIKDVMQPQFEDEDPTNPFDFWKGANFKLKIRNVEGYRNYDKSEFAQVSALFEGW